MARVEHDALDREREHGPREASRRGLRVALLEARDFAAGTSSRSSKLIHGGLRYLAMGDVPLVRSTALERKEVHRLAPHLAEPLAPPRGPARGSRTYSPITDQRKPIMMKKPENNAIRPIPP